MNKVIGDRISAMRKEMNLTQLQLAEKLNISDKAVSKWESGNGDPSIEMLILLSDLFNCTIDYLVKGTKNISKRNNYLLKQDPEIIEFYKNVLNVLKEVVSEKDFKICFKDIKPIRIIDENFILQVKTNFLKDYIESNYLDAIKNAARMFNRGVAYIVIVSEELFEDVYFKKAVEHLLFVDTVSISSLQRVMGIGFPKAGKLIGILETLNFISKPDRKNKREIYFTIDDYENIYGNVELT